MKIIEPTVSFSIEQHFDTVPWIIQAL